MYRIIPLTRQVREQYTSQVTAELGTTPFLITSIPSLTFRYQFHTNYGKLGNPRFIYPKKKKKNPVFVLPLNKPRHRLDTSMERGPPRHMSEAPQIHLLSHGPKIRPRVQLVLSLSLCGLRTSPRGWSCHPGPTTHCLQLWLNSMAHCPSGPLTK